jgi:hypothetical protein
LAEEIALPVPELGFERFSMRTQRKEREDRRRSRVESVE